MCRAILVSALLVAAPVMAGDGWYPGKNLGRERPVKALPAPAPTPAPIIIQQPEPVAPQRELTDYVVKAWNAAKAVWEMGLVARLVGAWLIWRVIRIVSTVLRTIGLLPRAA